MYQIPLLPSSISGDTEFFYTLTGGTSSSTFLVILLFYGPCPLLGLDSAKSAKAERTLVPPKPFLGAF